MFDCNELIDRLTNSSSLEREELLFLLSESTPEQHQRLYARALDVRTKHYGRKVYMRGLIEISTYCSRGCLYCGLNCYNSNAERFRLSEETILLCCEQGYSLGFRTFVWQSGEDSYWTDERLESLIRSVKQRFPDCALTLSLGERSHDSYRRLKAAGSDRYLLRHETAFRPLYERVHRGMSFDRRRSCLQDLKQLGFQVGAGFLVGLPNQGLEELVEDLIYLKELDPQMVGIGPFVPHSDTLFGHAKRGDIDLTLLLLACVRLLLPRVLIPATTALATIDPDGRNKALQAGANVIMPNLSPVEMRKKYSLYDGKKIADSEAAEALERIEQEIRRSGFEISMEKGDYAGI